MDVLAENAARIFGKIHRNCALSAILGAVERARAAFALAGAAAVRSSAHAEIACPEPSPSSYSLRAGKLECENALIYMLLMNYAQATHEERRTGASLL